ncbi:MAG: secondary thiamine-phosphate synthase enzyme YjbQ [Abditibacteriales bacterium]|nr:secondary thiamine-phosphate synthase enzyme YjbQ [Abditibacteriales bacterium]MDW8364633.1 secondary thiamine-phosphate synthase enzyme YjbQ [Abditibacteriales bacterium]
MFKRLSIPTRHKTEFIDVTAHIAQAVQESGVREGLCTVFVPHTTAGVCIQENADPNVPHDLINALHRLVPDDIPYLHVEEGEENAPSHVRAMLVGSSQSLIVEGGQLRLGRWQAVFFCEFDGPRSREIWLHINGQ